MDPRLAAVCTFVLMCFGVTCYFLHIPEDLAKKSGKVGHWGPPNAEFNWCEADYELTDWVAEPLNTVSTMATSVPPLVFWALHRSMELDAVLLVLIQVLIGIGSALFHATLRYSMQLMDEVPMLWYSQFFVAALVWRVYKSDMFALAGVWCSCLTVLVLLTEQHSGVHEGIRGAMTLSFASAVVFMGYGASSLNSEWMCNRCATSNAYIRMTTLCAVAFVSSLVCWLVDNYFCPVLQALPLGLPYPQLHTWWHLLISYCLVCLLSALQLHDQNHKEKGREHLRFELHWGMPMVVA